MRWPSPQDYREAIQSPSSLADEELRSFELELDSLQLPRVQTGQYAAVFKLDSPGKSYALRCFLHDFSDRTERYRAISDFILKDDLEYTVDFHLIERGIKVGSEWFPILKMEYVEGETLGHYVRRVWDNSEKLKELLAAFELMMRELKSNGIAHGDLQHDNIIVKADGSLRLIDYDGMFVPALAGKRSNELGHRNYQHPARSDNHFGPYLDNFSAWLIRGALLALAETPSLGELLKQKEECLFLCREDFLLPNTSKVFFDLEENNEHSRRFSRQIRSLLLESPESLPFIDQSLKPARLSKVEPAKLPVRVAASSGLPNFVGEWRDSPLESSSASTALSLKIPKNYAGSPVLRAFPNKIIASGDSRKPTGYKAMLLTKLRETLSAKEPVVWTGGLSPLKVTTGQQSYVGPQLSRSIALGIVFLCAMPLVLSHLEYFASVAGLLLAVLALYIANSQNGSAVLYALTEQALYVCIDGPRCKGYYDKVREYSYWDISAVQIPLQSIVLAKFPHQGELSLPDTSWELLRSLNRSESMQERVELIVNCQNDKGEMVQSSFWLHGFLEGDRDSLRTHLRSLGIQCE
ncbi:MAG: hypothetical protein K2X27_13015 [Candidatus Obscuribacterales bacterium]|nr:hypothetical protein [Candidatus Obscuribacterales bacterium]